SVDVVIVVWRQFTFQKEGHFSGLSSFSYSSGFNPSAGIGGGLNNGVIVTVSTSVKDGYSPPMSKFESASTCSWHFRSTWIPYRSSFHIVTARVS
ncbi:MAG: hypothetical protein GY835_28340, partial [bacterium]|nr:hypothetical protein [bacterium]